MNQNVPSIPAWQGAYIQGVAALVQRVELLTQQVHCLMLCYAVTMLRGQAQTIQTMRSTEDLELANRIEALVQDGLRGLLAQVAPPKDPT